MEPYRMRLKLNTLPETRQTLARVIRYYALGKLEETTFKNLVYGLSHLCSYWKLEQAEELERRIEALESQGNEFKKQAS